MWPYNEDEAGWLTPRHRGDAPRRGSANDNDRDPAALRGTAAPAHRPVPEAPKS